ncbi:MAG: hypothetical protein OEX80_10155 [Candidatus Aminicenantes bacterium]|nr:hypothetical protein [Candidatus Aminicenantes bacterium]
MNIEQKRIITPVSKLMASLGGLLPSFMLIVGSLRCMIIMLRQELRLRVDTI